MKANLDIEKLGLKIVQLKRQQEKASLSSFWAIQTEINKTLEELTKIHIKEGSPTDFMRKVNSDVLSERLRQNYMWGKQRHSHGDWLKILIEEVGEVAQAMQKDKHWGKKSDADDLYTELIHVSAVASAMAEQVLEGRVRK